MKNELTLLNNAELSKIVFLQNNALMKIMGNKQVDAFFTNLVKNKNGLQILIEFTLT